METSKLDQLKIEREALTKEDDKASKERLLKLQGEIDNLEQEYQEFEEVWVSEKAALHGSASIKEKLEQARLELETARRANDLTRMSELQYGRIPELEKQLDMAAQAEISTTCIGCVNPIHIRITGQVTIDLKNTIHVRIKFRTLLVRTSISI